MKLQSVFIINMIKKYKKKIYLFFNVKLCKIYLLTSYISFDAFFKVKNSFGVEDI